jgi:hypothetical protein
MKSSVRNVESLKRNVIVEKLELTSINREELLEGSFYLCRKVYVDRELYLIDWICLQYKDGFLTDVKQPYYDPEKFDKLYELPLYEQDT